MRLQNIFLIFYQYLVSDSLARVYMLPQIQFVSAQEGDILFVIDYHYIGRGDTVFRRDRGN